VDETAQPGKEPVGVGDDASVTPTNAWQPGSNGAYRDTNGTSRLPGLRTADAPWSSAGAALEPSMEPATNGWRRAATSGMRGRAEVRTRYADLLAPVSPAVPPAHAEAGETPSSAPPYPYEGDLPPEPNRPWAPPRAVDRPPIPGVPTERAAPPAEFDPFRPSSALTDPTYDDLPALAQAAAAASQAASAARAAAGAAAAEARAVVDDRAAVQAAFQQAAQRGTPPLPDGRAYPMAPGEHRPPADFRPPPQAPGAPPDPYRARTQVNGTHPAPAPVNGTRDPRIPTGFATPPPARPAVPEYRPPGVAIPAPPPVDARSQLAGDHRAPAPAPLPPARSAPPPAGPPTRPGPMPPTGFAPSGRSATAQGGAPAAALPIPAPAPEAPVSAAPMSGAPFSAAPASGIPTSGGPLSAGPLPQRIPSPPDVPPLPDEPEDQFVEPGTVRVGVDKPDLARIATGLRYKDDFEEQAAPSADGFDFEAVQAAVKKVPGVRNAEIKPNATGVHTLRLDLEEGADPAQVSRLVARLLKQKMGLAAEPRRSAAPPRLPAPPGGPEPSAEDRARQRHHPVTPSRARGAEETEHRRPTRAGAAPRVVLDQVQVSTLGMDATVEVRLTGAGNPAIGVASGPALDGYVLRLAAVAATSAIDQLLARVTGEQHGRSFVEHAAVVPFGSCEVAVTVILLAYGGTVEQLTGSALVSGDPRQAVVRATLAAVNRRLDALLS
jgi:hypothetical protein